MTRRGILAAIASLAAAPAIAAPGAGPRTLLVTGQMIAALAIDHYGVLGFPVRTLDGWRVAGALLVYGTGTTASRPISWKFAPIFRMFLKKWGKNQVERRKNSA